MNGWLPGRMNKQTDEQKRWIDRQMDKMDRWMDAWQAKQTSFFRFELCQTVL